MPVIGYSFKDNAFTKEQVSVPERRVSWEIGDAKRPDMFFPQLKQLHHDNTGNLSVRLAYPDYAKGTLSEFADRLDWDVVEMTARFYEQADPATEGTFEFEIILKTQPVSPWLDLTITSKQFEFWPQPSLSAADIAGGSDRPEDIIDSIAVYYASHANNRVGGYHFRTGKVCHIKRVKLTDATGKSIWGKLLMLSPSLWRISWEHDMAFHASAVFPVVVDPTFGTTAQGGTGQGFGDAISGGNKTISENGTGVSMEVWIGGTNTNVTAKCNVYNADNSALTNGQTGARSFNPTDTGAVESFTFTTAPSFVSGTAYFLAGWAINAPGTELMYWDTGASQEAAQNLAYGTWPDPLVPSSLSRVYSIYCTYTVAGGIIPIIDAQFRQRRN